VNEWVVCGDSMGASECSGVAFAIPARLLLGVPTYQARIFFESAIMKKGVET
jgi:hypothetical protein